MSHFIDTNIAVYAFLPGDKADVALAALTGATISVQVLNEFSNVALRKLGYDVATLQTRINAIAALTATITAVDLQTHHLACAIVDRYKLSFYDSLLVAAALLAECDTLYSEDMQNGMIIEGRLAIRNPFVD